MIKKNLVTALIRLSLYIVFMMIFNKVTYAQIEGPQQQEVKWLSTSALRHWISSAGAEVEYGRRGRSGFLNVDQMDGLIWPSEYTRNKGVNVSKALWIGTTNFTEMVDNLKGKTFPYKVLCIGPREIYLGSDVYSEEFSLIGKYDHPAVYVDDASASYRDYDDELDKVDPDLPCDRMIVNKVHTDIGITISRKILSFSQQYHDNYIIYEYVFKNTGIVVDNSQPTPRLVKVDQPKTLTDVIFFWEFRYAFAGESYLNGWAPGSTSWGRNTINDAIGHDPNHPNPEGFKAIWSYYGPMSDSPGIAEDIGLPRHTDGSIMAGTNFAGVVVLHADKSPQDKSNDPNKLITTIYTGSDSPVQPVDQYNENLMTRKYNEFMKGGHPPKTHAEEIGKDPQTGWPTAFANTWGNDAGGYSATLGFGPYNLAPGDSVRIVIAEAVAGIDRVKNREVVNKWFNRIPPYVLPNGTETSDRNVYKNTWVFTGKDSLFQAFRRAIANFKSNYNIPQPPPPPDKFYVYSGGDRIILKWSKSAETWPNFNGYRIYRAEGRTDTTFSLIFECDKNNVVNTFEDKTAKRGFNYFYYIQTKDDGSTNNIQPGVPLVSSKYYTMTNREAFLTRPPGNNLSGIRIVPNPYNIRARELQFGLDTPDRIAFYGLPPKCKIRIYTETGDLIETIDHVNGSGDELWHSLTSSRQLVVSGLYIAHFEVTEDIYDDSGNIIFRKGDSTYKKFIVIR